MNFLAKIIGSYLAASRSEKKRKRKKFLLSDILENPENFVFITYIEDDEWIIRAKRKEKYDAEIQKTNPD